MCNDAVPNENLAIYKLLYHIEVGLREFIIEELETKVGPRWWKQRLPSDVKDTSKKGLQYEKGIKWSRIVPHHPIYYTDFPDLKKVITKGDNWQDVFQSIFEREDILVGTLSELEPIRNKVAHNRKATPEDLTIVEAVLQKIVTAIGEERFFRLVSKCTAAEDIAKSFLGLQQEAELAFKLCIEFEPLYELKNWEKIRICWWFDADYLAHEISGIKEYFKILTAYNQLPRLRGYGHKIEAWVNTEDIPDKYSKALQEFTEILKDTGEV